MLKNTHEFQDLITLFNHCFLSTYNTQLVKGEDEPLYVPADENSPHCALYFAHGFFASALHESAHWLIAGESRRKLVDFGYWYTPDGRTASEQELFQSVEIKPQAMEWILSVAANHRFRVSIDNLNGKESDTLAFKLAVYDQVKAYCQKGLPKRADLFRRALCDFYHTVLPLTIDQFDIETI